MRATTIPIRKTYATTRALAALFAAAALLAAAPGALAEPTNNKEKCEFNKENGGYGGTWSGVGGSVNVGTCTIVMTSSVGVGGGFGGADGAHTGHAFVALTDNSTLEGQRWEMEAEACLDDARPDTCGSAVGACTPDGTSSNCGGEMSWGTCALAMDLQGYIGVQRACVGSTSAGGSNSFAFPEGVIFALP